MNRTMWGCLAFILVAGLVPTPVQSAPSSPTNISEMLIAYSGIVGSGVSDLIRELNPHLGGQLPAVSITNLTGDPSNSVPWRGKKVIMITSAAPFDRPDVVGDVVANFVRKGLCIVNLLATWEATPQAGGIGGKFKKDEIGPFQFGTFRSTAPSLTLGQKNRNHPIMARVNRISVLSGAHRITPSSPVKNATVLASWNDGVPLLAEKVTSVPNGVGRVVSINIAGMELGSLYDGDAILMVANAMKWCKASEDLATSLAFVKHPPPTIPSSQTFQVVVELRDGLLPRSYDGLAVTLTLNHTSGRTNATLRGQTSAVTGGRRTQIGFDVDVSMAGTGYLLVAKAAHLGQVASNFFTVLSGEARQIAIIYSPTSAVRTGDMFSILIEVRDSQGNPSAPTKDTSFTLSLGTDPTNGLARLAAPPRTVADGSEIRFNFTGLRINKVGNGYTIQVTASDPRLLPGLTAPFDVSTGRPAKLVFLRAPTGLVTAGQPFLAEVEVQDHLGNPVGVHNGKLSIGIARGVPNAKLGGRSCCAQTTTDRQSVYLFVDLTLDRVGTNYNLSATVFNGSTNLYVTSNTFTVIGDYTKAITVTPPIPFGVQTAGTPFDIRVELKDSLGNPGTMQGGSTLRLTLARGPSRAQLYGKTAYVISFGESGHTFQGLVLTRADTSYSIQANLDGCCGNRTTNFEVRPAAPTRIVFSTQPPSVFPAGQTFQVTVQLLDFYSNPSYPARENIKLKLKGCADTANSTLRCDSMNGNQDLLPNGNASDYFFSALVVRRSGGYRLEVSTGSKIKNESIPFTVRPGLPLRMLVKPPLPSKVVANQFFRVVLEVQDGLGNPAPPGQGREIRLRLSSDPSLGKAAMLGTLVAQTQSEDATYIFNYVKINFASSGYQITGELSPDGWKATTPPFTVISGRPAKLKVTRCPYTEEIANSNITMHVQLQDEGGNPTISPSTIIEARLGRLGTQADATTKLEACGAGVSSQGSRPTLAGTLALYAGSGPTVRFEQLLINKVGKGFTLSVSNRNRTLQTAESCPFDVVGGKPERIMFFSIPNPVIVNSTFAVSVAVVDTLGNPVQGQRSGTIELSVVVSGDPRNLTLGPNAQLSQSIVPDDSGVCFNGLSLPEVGTHIKLQAALISAERWVTISEPLNVTYKPLPKWLQLPLPTQNSDGEGSNGGLMVVLIVAASLCLIMVLACLWLSAKRAKQKRLEAEADAINSISPADVTGLSYATGRKAPSSQIEGGVEAKPEDQSKQQSFDRRSKAGSGSIAPPGMGFGAVVPPPPADWHEYDSLAKPSQQQRDQIAMGVPVERASAYEYKGENYGPSQTDYPTTTINTDIAGPSGHPQPQHPQPHGNPRLTAPSDYISSYPMTSQ